MKVLAYVLVVRVGFALFGVLGGVGSRRRGHRTRT